MDFVKIVDFFVVFRVLVKMGICIVLVFMILVIKEICLVVNNGEGVIRLLIFLVLRVDLVDWMVDVCGIFLFFMVFIYW